MALTPNPELSAGFMACAPLSEARRRLAEPRRPEASLRLLGSAALLALSALLLAGAVILGPFWQTRDPPAIAIKAFR